MSFVDIIGQPLEVELFYANKGQDTPVDHAILEFLFFLKSQGETMDQQQNTIKDINKFLSTPLSDYFDKAWAVDLTSSVIPEGRQPHPKPPKPTPKPLPPTIRNTVIDRIWAAIGSAIGDAFVIQKLVNVPFKGPLQAAVVTGQNPQVLLRYGILCNEIQFYNDEFYPTFY